MIQDGGGAPKTTYNEEAAAGDAQTRDAETSEGAPCEGDEWRSAALR